MVIKGKLIIEFKGDIEKERKFWEEIDKFLKFENKYFFEYYQFDDYYSKPSFHSSTSGKYLSELIFAHELNAYKGEHRIYPYPYFCRFIRIYEILNQFELNKDIWKNIF